MLAFLKRIESFVDVEHMFQFIFGAWIEQVFTSATTDYTITHNLRRTPIACIPVLKDTFGNFKVVSKDKTTIVLQSDTNSTTATFWIL